MTELTKEIKKVYKVLDVTAIKAIVKAKKTDIGGEFYVYDLYDNGGKLIALNQYVRKNSDTQLFKTLTADEEIVLNPPMTAESEMEDLIAAR